MRLYQTQVPKGLPFFPSIVYCVIVEAAELGLGYVLERLLGLFSSKSLLLSLSLINMFINLYI